MAQAARLLAAFVTASGLAAAQSPVPTVSSAGFGSDFAENARGLLVFGGLAFGAETVVAPNVNVPSNLALYAGAFAFGSNASNAGNSDFTEIIDGKYGNAHAWISPSRSAFAGIVLGRTISWSGFAFGRDGFGGSTDRSLGQYVWQYTSAYLPDAASAVSLPTNEADPYAGWVTVGKLWHKSGNASATPPAFSVPYRRHTYTLPSPVVATALKLSVVSFGEGSSSYIAVDEVEVFGDVVQCELG